ncbi:hypothetical protein VTO73DRAFT_13868 [Trametes versicolor]
MNATIPAQFAAATLIEEQSLIITEKCFYLAVLVLLLWDLLLTFDTEAAFFWRRRISGAAALFFANRYLTLLIALYNASWYGMLHYSNTAFFQHSQYIIWAAFNCLRVYALQRPRWRCAAVVLVLSLVVVAADVVSTIPSYSATAVRAQLARPRALVRWVLSTEQQDRSTGILQRYVPSSVNALIPGGWLTPPRTLAQICCCMLLVVAELVVMAVTWAEMAQYRQSTDFRRVLTLSCVLYENGRAYFVSTMVMHTLHLVSPLLSVRTPRARLSGKAPPLTPDIYPQLAIPASPARAPDMMSLSIILVEPIIAILVNRFLLALQAAAASASAPHSVATLALSAVDSGRGSVGLLQFVRADVDEWIQSEVAASTGSVDSDEATLDGERGGWGVQGGDADGPTAGR